ncbi:MAG: hypothetical protein JWQ89_4115 [Devosia sp.]|uniref:hypothetical protein n=1 Tax=Devosia sp. TaxID=1871048 RepID=UPI00260BB14E|nr:hypothetical protein [Devosia sp.]MDB5542388.1 hypothetical protein [Devosia sp.]
MTFLRRLLWRPDKAAGPRRFSLSRLPRGWVFIVLALAGWLVVLLLWLFFSFLLAQFS